MGAAAKETAKKYHIEIKEKELTNEERQAESERESMFIVNE
jgi:DNA primase